MNLILNCISRGVSRTFKSVFVTLAAVSVAASIGCGLASDDAEPLVFAAASLSDVFSELAEEYEATAGDGLTFNFAGSTLLANQIISGAPASAIVTAGYSPIRDLIVAGVLDETNVERLFGNSVVIVKSGSYQGDQAMSIEELVDAGRVAIPDPALAPAGEYAESALRSHGIWDSLAGQIIPALDVRAALAAASIGNAEWAIVYRTDAMSSPNVTIVKELAYSDELHAPSYYFAPLVEDAVMMGFLYFLGTEAAEEIIERHGFVVSVVETEVRSR